MSQIEVLNSALAIGWVKFAYIKADGTKRVAIGTRNSALIESILGKRTNERTNNNYFRNCNGYFDLTCCDWRQFNEHRFLGMIFDKMSNVDAVREAVIVAMSEKDAYEVIDKIHLVAERLFCPKVVDEQIAWCIRHNGGRGLNGVLISAGENGGSGCLGWPSASAKAEPMLGLFNEITRKPSEKKDLISELKNEITRKPSEKKDLISELKKVRLRQVEILAEMADLQSREEEILNELL